MRKRPLAPPDATLPAKTPRLAPPTRAPRDLTLDEASAACDSGFWISCVHDSRCDRRRSGCDLMTFRTMVHDKLRMRSYERDIMSTVCGKRVLEIGTGALAPLTQMCLAAGAAEVVTIERSAWAAEAATELLASHRNCHVVNADAATLTVSDVGGAGHFDVLVHEIYGCVAGAEDVLETFAALRRSGFSWMQTISRGFEVAIAPCKRPPLEKLATPMWSLCANPNGEPGLEDDLGQYNWSVHNCPDVKKNMLLSTPKVWQCGNLQEGTHSTASTLTFTVPAAIDGTGFKCDGLLFSSRFFFHCAEDTLDTLNAPTHWGTFFVPFKLPDVEGYAGPVILEVRTDFEEDSGPSRFELRVRLGQLSVPTVDDHVNGCEQTDNRCINWSEWVCDEASRYSGLPSHEYFM